MAIGAGRPSGRGRNQTKFTTAFGAGQNAIALFFTASSISGAATFIPIRGNSTVATHNLPTHRHYVDIITDYRLKIGLPIGCPTAGITLDPTRV